MPEEEATRLVSVRNGQVARLTQAYHRMLMRLVHMTPGTV